MKAFMNISEWFPVYYVSTEEDLQPETMEDYAKTFGDKAFVEIPEHKVKEMKKLLQEFKEMQLYLKKLIGDDSPVIYLE